MAAQNCFFDAATGRLAASALPGPPYQKETLPQDAFSSHSFECLSQAELRLPQ